MTVQEWLDSGRDYEVGQQLYAVLGDNDRLKRTLRSGPNHYNREAVAWELTKLARAGVGQLSVMSYELVIIPEKDTSSNPEISPNATFSLQKDTSSPEKGTKLLDELKDTRRLLYDERAGVHAQLEGAASEEERRLMAVRVMTLSRQLDANWEANHYVQAHGELPPAPAAAPGLDQLSPEKLLRKKLNLRSQVTKLKKQPHRAADLVRVEAELAQVETLLNPIDGQ